MEKVFPFAYFHKKIIPAKNAKISIASNSLQYGTSLFSGIRGYYDSGKIKIFRLRDHHARMMSGAKILGMEIQVPWGEFQKNFIKLTELNKPRTNVYYRPFFYSEDENLNPCFHELDFQMAIFMTDLTRSYDLAKGLRLMISSWRKTSDTAISTKAKAGGGYVNSSLALSEASRYGYDEALMMDEQGNIVEASAANLFIVWRGEVFMPETGSSMLEGITRRTAVEFLEEEGIKVRQGRIDRSMIYSCDEVILTGTYAQVLFTESVDGRTIGQKGKPGPICQLLQKKLKMAIKGQHPKSPDWLTEVSIR